MAANEGTNGHTEVPSDLERKIIKQIEFYFGDKNLPRDKFLRQKVDEDEGWVTLECLTTFNRLKALSTDTDAIAKALRKSEAGLLEVSEDNKKVRRVTAKPLPEETAEARHDAKTKTVYCKGFPAETTIDQLEEFFSDKGKVNMLITSQWILCHLFKGSAFVEFSTVDEAKAFVATEALKYNEQELIKMMKADYFKKKEEEFKLKKEKQERYIGMDLSGYPSDSSGHQTLRRRPPQRAKKKQKLSRKSLEWPKVKQTCLTPCQPSLPSGEHSGFSLGRDGLYTMHEVPSRTETKACLPQKKLTGRDSFG
ncbi:unnamed protein product [Porites lobata]|uniref:Uncharacterized protein n=1 Tax=Porites lobata TaxID=104759 RepID=A0ABN8QCX6_9CNID|nr:unnamed protein product [Porites lobata]